MPRHIELAAERAIVVRLVLAFLRQAQKRYFRDVPFFRSTELSLVLLCVFDAHQADRCCTVSYLANCTGMSRRTVKRRLSRLITLRYVECECGNYRAGQALVVPPGGRRAVRALIAKVQDAAHQLGKLPK